MRAAGTYKASTFMSEGHAAGYAQQGQVSREICIPVAIIRIAEADM